MTFNYPGTPLGVAFDQIGDNIANNGWVDNLEPGQKNFIVHMTDGKDDCECLDFQYEDGTTTIDIRGSAAGPEVTISADLSGDKLIRTFNASLKAEKTLKQIDPTLDGSKGNIYMVGMGLGDTEKEMTHHLSWVSSGARLGRDRSLMHPAVFGNEIDELVDTLMEVLGIISTPVTEVSLGQSVVGSVKELIHLADSTITAPDLIADDVAGSLDKDDTDDARKIRNQYPNNVLFATSVVTPEWEGHLKAFNIYKVVNKGTAQEKRVADYSQVWDAGEVLRDVDPDDRSVLFNRLGDTPGSYPSNFHDGEVCPGGNGFFLARLDIEKADRVPARTTRQAAAGTYGCLFSSGEADASAEKHDRCIAVLAPLEAASGRAAEGEDSLSLEKELALFGEEQAEAREVDLLFIRFDLRKIRIDGEVRDEALRDAVFGIEADVGAESVLHRWRRGSIGR